MRTGYLRTIVTIALVGILGCTVLGFLGGYSWFFDLFVHFRLQYLLIGLFFIIVTVYLNFRVLMLMALLIVFINGSLVLSVYDATAITEGTHEIKVLSFNVNHDGVSADTLSAMVRDNDVDVLILAEIGKDTVLQVGDELGYEARFAPRRQRDTFGVGMLSRLPNFEMEAKDFGGDDVLSIEATFNGTDDKPCTLIAAHTFLPLTSDGFELRNRQLLAIANYAKDKQCFAVIGDLNITPWSPIFNEVLETGNLKDSRIGFGNQVSWPTFLPNFMRIPIDHALVSSSIGVVSRSILNSIGSDHYPLFIEMALY